MTNTSNRPPLWEVMTQARFDAYRKATGLPPEEEYAAAEIRALRDWLVPEEAEAPVSDGEPWPQSYQHRSDAMWEQRQILRALLTTEADRAERGDG